MSDDVPLPRPDPRGPPVSYGPKPNVTPSQPYGMSDHMKAVVRALFEGTEYRQRWAPYRDETGLYDKK